jgi:hypothetical protein
MKDIPIEILQIIANKLCMRDYLRLRGASWYHQKLDKFPRLEFEAYKKTTEMLHDFCKLKDEGEDSTEWDKLQNNLRENFPLYKLNLGISL